jgi:hypothetical protein
MEIPHQMRYWKHHLFDLFLFARAAVAVPGISVAMVSGVDASLNLLIIYDDKVAVMV